MRRATLLFLLIIPFIGFAQVDQPTGFKKFGVGVGYNFHSVMNDSIRPLELSLHYRINDKHKLHLFAPLSYDKKELRNVDDTWKKTLWGIGLGYDYAFYTHSFIGFFAGVSTDYQKYQNRHDKYYKGPRYSSDESLYEVEETYYYWDKVNGLNIVPNIGLRFSLKQLTSEIRLNVPLSRLRKESYSFYKEIYPAGNSTWESLYPDRKINELKTSVNISAYISYYF